MRPKVFITLMLLFLFLGILVGFYVEHYGVEKIKKQQEWSIGIYTGDTPFNITPSSKNPILTKEDVTDLKANFVADPFIINAKGLWYMFFEVKDSYDLDTQIAYATSRNGEDWQYQKVILNENFPQSYPGVFEWEGQYYMVPESYPTKSVRLYKAKSFPEEWLLDAVLIRGRDYVDPTIYRNDDKWWMFVSTAQNDNLYLFYSYNLRGPWVVHPMSPIVDGDRNIARPGGRIIEYNNSIYRVAQDDDPYYGNQVRVFKINELSVENYSEMEIDESPIISAGNSSWASKGMHQFDAQQMENGKWLIAVDGFKEVLRLQ